jgi:tripartite-type tricarboxylate transporter receptor subunit TctC
LNPIESKETDMRRLTWMALSCVPLMVTLTPLALAQVPGADWPGRPIRVIVPAPAGGAFDVTARALTQELSQLLKQPVVVDNRASAGNIIGTAAGAKAAPDGYTLTMTGMLNTMAHSLYANVPFDIVNDFTHVAGVAGGAQWLVVRSDLGVGSVADFMERARREPGRLHYATSGVGSTGHLLMELFQRATGVELSHVPYKGGAPALQDVLAGVVPVTVVPAAGAEVHVKSGKLKVLAASSATRAPQHPDVPTFAELGYPQLTVSSWVGLSVPKGTPQEIVRKLQAAVQASLTQPTLVSNFEKQGISPMPLTSDTYFLLVRNDTERWRQLIRNLNIKAE